ncbi:unnamed protein product, partial [Didymodactylos carnosus]
INAITHNDIIIQIASCSWDAHLLEILGSLILSATVIMLYPDGHRNMIYLLETIQAKRATSLGAVPTLLITLYEYLQRSTAHFDSLKTMRVVWTTGEVLLSQVVSKITPYLSSHCQIINLYGPTECTLGSMYHYVTQHDILMQSIPCGRPLSGYGCYLLDDYLQSVPINYEGKVYISGVGVFPGYLNNDELTRKCLLNIDKISSEKCYFTGDIGKLNSSGELLFSGRIDAQIKLRGQRIEVEEIQNTILKFFNLIENCLVVKSYNDKSQQNCLVAYLQTKSTNTNDLLINELREYCQLQLPQYMIPAMFITVDQFKLNANGKIDRKQLPQPDFSQLLNSVNNKNYIEPQTELEIQIHDLWCQVLNHEKISLNSNFFSLGGNSLSLMQLYNYYRAQFNVIMNISQLFKYLTINEHITQLSAKKESNMQRQWKPLNVIEGLASYAQERIWLDEKVRFSAQQRGLAIYNMPLVLKITQNSISIYRLLSSLERLIRKHSVLRTRIKYDLTDKCLKQSVNPASTEQQYSFQRSEIFTKEELQHILFNEETSSKYFNLEQGLVFRCHLIRCSENVDAALLIDGDMIIFNFHHIAFDGRSVDIFLNDLQSAYNDDNLEIQEDTLTYIDYSLYEREMDMSKAKQYWKEVLDGYHTDKLPLPYDFKHSEQRRTGQGSSVAFELDNDLVQQMLEYGYRMNVTQFQLCLCCYFVFLFKLSNSQDKDLCIGSVSANRHRQELQPLLGMFVNTLPYRLKLDAARTFNQTLQQVLELCLDILEFSYLPYQQIITSQEHEQLTPFILTTFILESNLHHLVHLNDSILCQLLDDDNIAIQRNVSKFDLSLLMNYNDRS